MDFVTMQTAVRARIGELTADFWTDVEVKQALNEGVSRFLSAEKWPWLFTTGTDTLRANEAKMALQSGVEYSRHFDIMLTSGSNLYPLLPIRVDPGTGFRIRRRWAFTKGFPRWYYLESEIDTGADEVQWIINTGSTTGTFTMTQGGQTSAAISRGAAAEDVQTALEALSSIGVDNVICDGGPLGTTAVSVTFVNALGHTDVGAITLGGTVTSMTVTEVDKGGAGTGAFSPIVHFVPTPSQAFSVEYQYVRTPSDLSNNGDVADIPEEYQQAAVAYAAGILWLKELTSGAQKSQEQMALYYAILNDCRSEQLRQAPSDIIAWGKEEPELVGRESLEDYVYSRIPPSVGQ